MINLLVNQILFSIGGEAKKSMPSVARNLTKKVVVKKASPERLIMLSLYVLLNIINNYCSK